MLNQRNLRTGGGRQSSCQRNISSAWLDASNRRPVYSQPGVTFDGKPVNFPALMAHFQESFAAKDLAALLGPTGQRPQMRDFYAPPAPVAELVDGVLVQMAPPPLTFEQQSFNLKVEESRTKCLGKYQRGVALLMAPLGTIAKNQVNNLFRDNALTYDRKFNSMLQLLVRIYTADLDTTYLEMYRILQQLPMALNHDEADILLGEIATVSMDMKELGADRELNESQKRTFLIQKLGPMFNDLVGAMEGGVNHAPYTFNQTLEELARKRRMDRVRDTNDRPESAIEPPSDPSSIGAAAPLVNTTVHSTASQLYCKNCKTKGDHTIQRCPSMCTLCTNPSRPHHPMDCPAFKERKQDASRPQPPPRVRQQGQGQEKRLRTPSLFDRATQKSQKRVQQVQGEGADMFDTDDYFSGELDEHDFDDLPSDDECAYNSMVAVEHQGWSDEYLSAHGAMDIFFKKPRRTVTSLPECFPAPYVRYATRVAGRVLQTYFKRTLGVLQVIQASSDLQLRTMGVPMIVRFQPPEDPEQPQNPDHHVHLALPNAWRRTAHGWIQTSKDIAVDKQRVLRRLKFKTQHRTPTPAVIAGPAKCYDPQQFNFSVRFQSPRRYKTRPYLEMCQFYRSSVHGRGRNYKTPWWLTATGAPRPSRSLLHTLWMVLVLLFAIISKGLTTPPGQPTTVQACSSPSITPLARSSCQGRSYECNLVTTHSEEAAVYSFGMLDSGANLPISHPHLAEMLDMQPSDWPSPVPIKFGNSSNGISRQYLDLGPLLGRIALVDSAQSTIITRRSLHRNGISVLFRADQVCQLVKEATQEVLFETVLAKPDDFFMIPLSLLLPPALASKLDAYLSHMPAEVNARRALPTVTAAEIAAVMSLHDRMYHPSAAVMARALRAGAWLGVDIAPTLVERVFNHRDCLFCALGKMKRVPRPLGSSIKPAFLAQRSRSTTSPSRPRLAASSSEHTSSWSTTRGMRGSI